MPPLKTCISVIIVGFFFVRVHKVELHMYCTCNLSGGTYDSLLHTMHISFCYSSSWDQYLCSERCPRNFSAASLLKRDINVLGSSRSSPDRFKWDVMLHSISSYVWINLFLAYLLRNSSSVRMVHAEVFLCETICHLPSSTQLLIEAGRLLVSLEDWLDDGALSPIVEKRGREWQ